MIQTDGKQEPPQGGDSGGAQPASLPLALTQLNLLELPPPPRFPPKETETNATLIRHSTFTYIKLR